MISSWRQPITLLPWAVGGLMVLALGCQGGTDNDQQFNPDDDPTEFEFDTGQAVLTLSDATLPADGSSLADATAVVTDARGLPLSGATVTFTSTVAGVTWLDAREGEGGVELFPSDCLAVTDSNGEATCTFRAGFAEQSGLILASSRLSSDSAQVTFTDGETVPGLQFDFLTGSCEPVDQEDLPLTRRIAFSGVDSEGRPAEGVRISLSTTYGRFRRTQNSRSSDVLDAQGLGYQDLELSNSVTDRVVNVVGSGPGHPPAICTISIGDFNVSLTLSAFPSFVRADGTAQSIELTALLDAPNAPNESRQVRWSTRIGSIQPNPTRFDPTGTARATLFLSAQTSQSLVVGESLLIVAVDTLSGQQAELTLPVQVAEEITIEVTPNVESFELTGGFLVAHGDVTAVVRKDGVGAGGRFVDFDTDGTPADGSEVTDTNGVAILPVDWQTDLTVENPTFQITATDRISNVIAEATLTIETDNFLP